MTIQRDLASLSTSSGTSRSLEAEVDLNGDSLVQNHWPLVVEVVDPGGAPLHVLGRLVDPADGGTLCHARTNVPGSLVLLPPATAAGKAARLFLHPEPGHWATVHDLTVTLEAPKRGAVTPRLTVPGLPLPQLPWWRAVTRLSGSRGGAGIRIGVIDTAWHEDTGLKHVKKLTCDGTAGRLAPRSHPGFWSHGEQVARLLFASSAHGGPLAGMALGAEAIAMFVGKPSVRPDLSEIASAILVLSLEHHVDLINISAGVYEAGPMEEAGVRDAIDTAWENGTVCVAAAGNEDRSAVAFPASLDRVLAVGAVGWDEPTWGPATSLVRALRDEAHRAGLPRGTSESGHRVFSSPRSSYGRGLNLVAPGVGLLSARDGRPAFDLSGTSFACPTAVAVLAGALAEDDDYKGLPRDSDRARWVVDEVLPCYACNAGLGQARQGLGVLAL